MQSDQSTGVKTITEQPQFLFPPFVYDCDRSIHVYGQSKTFMQEKGYWERISDLAWAYTDIGDLIPHTSENLWSGHFFPWTESWNELQISFDLCLFGLYKQAMVSLRCGLELGLLSVYWNLNDDGHETIQEWFHSQEDTPFRKSIFRKLDQHRNFELFQQKYDLKSRLGKLDFLHDYVHTKGGRYSNRFGLPKPNFQTFEERGFLTWFGAFEEVIELLAIFHLVKYPIGTIGFNYYEKFGIDTPAFGGLDRSAVDRLENIVGEEVFEIIGEVALADQTVRNILEWVSSLPDMTEEQRETQIIEFEKTDIQQSGLEEWLEQEKLILESWPTPEEKGKEKYLRRIELLTQWAKDNGFEKPPWERQRSK